VSDRKKLSLGALNVVKVEVFLGCFIKEGSLSETSVISGSDKRSGCLSRTTGLWCVAKACLC